MGPKGVTGEGGRTPAAARSPDGPRPPNRVAVGNAGRRTNMQL